MKPLFFRYQCNGTWTAESILIDGQDSVEWKIEVTEDGFFDVGASAGLLLPAPEPGQTDWYFVTLREAKDWASRREGAMIQEIADGRF